MKVEMWPINKPTPYDKNPRIINKRSVDEVVKSLPVKLTRHMWTWYC
ncbi:hypothetical protein LCGC14_1162820 [marine sediment metagenome]|uniref:Uncharacterized protein n=1 Tax=marine sediment metagenome TaxID=412755 RepID=A0A0F9PXP3_9ZZZZ